MKQQHRARFMYNKEDLYEKGTSAVRGIKASHFKDQQKPFSVLLLT